ncbi:20023_t:CDS:2 [Funneliformis geosporum]|uniref:9501_t:CDS:1 n=1 Tax=Funneliformis geosporum TaxID=1117311 RepID=A0A9W4WUK4_9GLOM|nr:20023_t:CDS:2 [Funneliformis geosporum]CAI2187006.1 9501_t:CDS:2 [Funneliformis geosporum]
MTQVNSHIFPFGDGSWSAEGEIIDVDISDINIVLICNNDIRLATQIVNRLRKRGAKKIRLCYPEELQIKYVKAEIDAIGVPVYLQSQAYFEWNIIDATVVISLLYNNFDKQEMLFNACIRQSVPLFITWDSGMELELFVKDKECPRTRLHKKFLDHQLICKSHPCGMHWILFQVGIFEEEILKHDISTITTAFNSPNQYIFLNVTIKEDLAQLVVESMISRTIQLNRNYVVGDFIAHTFLGHVYQVANNGMKYNHKMPASITEFETSNQLRLAGIVSARPLPRILYPGCSIFLQKLGIEVSFQHDATIYKILRHHQQITLKQWFLNKISNPAF